MAGPVAEFMQGRAMPVDRLEIALRPWQLDVVVRRSVEGLVAAKPQVGAAGADQRLDLGDDQPFRDRWRHSDEIIGQAVALRGVEDRESFEERDGYGFVARLARTAAFIVGNKAVGIDDGRAAFALPHIAAKTERLAEGEPALRGEAMLTTAPQRMSTLIPEYPRPVAAFFGMASGAETPLDPQG